MFICIDVDYTTRNKPKKVNTMKTKLSALILVITVSMLMAVAGSATEDGCERCHQDIADDFETSLHHTGLGMYDEYERGAAGYFDIDMDEYYDKFKCAKCHAVSCTDCHPGQNMYESHLYEVTIETCSKCHDKKQSSTYVGDMPMHKAKGPNADIHYEKGIDCKDCHVASELHGTGIKYDTQLEAVNVECTGCHKDVEESRSHTIHDGKLDCKACHSGWVLHCDGCHLDTRKGMKATADRFYLGRNIDGEITTFLKMEAIIGNETHIGAGEWYSHTITAEGKQCVFCHETPEVLCEGIEAQIIGEGGELLDQETIDRILAADLTEPKKSFWIDLFAKLAEWRN